MAELIEMMNDYVKQEEVVCRKNDSIDQRLYDEYGVNRGLRDEKGNGVLTGLTRVSKIVSTRIEGNKKVPCDGELWYRGYRVEKLINDLGPEKLGFEKIAYLLLMGELPTEKEEARFKEVIAKCRTLPTNFTRDVIMKAPSEDIMNSMTRSILTLASYDRNAKDVSVSNSLRQ
ncbi:MAG: citrate/2-methylcitrate synthase, partial [Dorea sp.]